MCNNTPKVAERSAFVIAKLTGKIDAILEDSIIIDVGGVGYQVFVSDKLRAAVAVGEACSIRTVHVIKQENQYFCGFQNEMELRVFKALQDVPGVGMKTALAVLSALSVEEFAMAVVEQDAVALCGVDGIGRKTAERILLELKDKNLTKMKGLEVQQKNANVGDAILGLMSLGYQKNSAVKIIKGTAARLGSEASASALIVEGLKETR